MLSESGTSLESSSELPQREPDENIEEPDLAIDYNKLCSPKRVSKTLLIKEQIQILLTLTLCCEMFNRAYY